MQNIDNGTEPGGENSTQTNPTNNLLNNNNNNINNNNNNLAPLNRQPTMGHSTLSPLTSGACVTSAVSAASNTIGGCTRECAGCGKRIIERFLLKALDLFWHEDCLKCGCCDCRLGEVGSTLYTKANLILCKRDYLRLFGTTGYCAACNKVIPAFEMVMRAKKNVYHLECFACQQCNHRFCVGDRFYLCDNKILCEYDYEERLVFANMAYNPSSLAHIRRQPAGDSMNCGTGGRMTSANNPSSSSLVPQQPPTLNRQQQQQLHHHQQLQQQQQQLHHQQQQQQQQHCYGGVGVDNIKIPIPAAPSNNMIGVGHRDDGSSGYGSPDSETFESPQAQ